MPQANTVRPVRERHEPATAPHLDRLYREIGISAVAAAARYRPEPPRAPVYAPVYTREQD